MSAGASEGRDDQTAEGLEDTLKFCITSKPSWQGLAIGLFIMLTSMGILAGGPTPTTMMNVGWLPLLVGFASVAVSIWMLHKGPQLFLTVSPAGIRFGKHGKPLGTVPWGAVESIESTKICRVPHLLVRVAEAHLDTLPLSERQRRVMRAAAAIGLHESQIMIQHLDAPPSEIMRVVAAYAIKHGQRPDRPLVVPPERQGTVVLRREREAAYGA